LGRYLLGEELGAGGMGRVFRATLLGPAGFKKTVALKLLPGPVDDVRARFREAFLNEARLGAMLRHPNVLTIHDLGVEEGTPFIAMELIEGFSLHEMLVGGRPIPPFAQLQIASQAARGLAHAHSLDVGSRTGLVHRDIKPANVMIDRHGVVRLVDFGLAAAVAAAEGATQPTGRRRVLGTPGYFSPEQILGEGLDGRSDLYSLGVVLAEIALGRRLLPSKDLARYEERLVALDREVSEGLLAARIDEHLPGLGPILSGLLAFRRDDRTPDATTFARAVEPLLRDHSEPGVWHAWAADLAPAPPVGGHTVAPPTEAITRMLGNVGPEPDTFVGREDEQAALADAVGTSRLVTLTGFGGTGKTRLARRVASRVARRLEGGAWFVDLAGTRDRAGIARAATRVFGGTLSGDVDADLEAVGDGLGLRGAMVVVVDNAEQVRKDAAAAVSIWLDRAPEARFVVTSRAALDVPWERVMPLAPLSPLEAVELFCERLPGGVASLSGPEHLAIGDLVQRLDGLPLAVELAARRATLMPPSTILARLDDRFRMLTSRRDDRHAGLQTCIEWSWDLLDRWERSVLAQLSVFHGATLEAVEAVVRFPEDPDAPWIVDVIESLVGQSLVVADPGAGKPRLRLLESIREFATAKLERADAGLPFVEDPPEQSTRAAHAAWYGSMPPGYAHVADPARGKDRSELANLVATLRWALEAGEIEPACGAFIRLGDVYSLDGPMSLLVEEGLRVVGRPEFPDATRPARFRVLHTLGNGLRRVGRFAEALEHLDRAQPLYRTEPQRLELVHRRALTLASLGRLADARALMERNLEERLALDPISAGNAASGLGVVIAKMEGAEAALPMFERAVSLGREIGEPIALSVALANHGEAFLRMGRRGEAEPLLRASLELIGDARPLLAATKWTALGRLLLEEGRVEDAFEAFSSSVEECRRIGHVLHLAAALAGLGAVLAARGRRETAGERLKEALDLAPGHEDADSWRELLAELEAHDGSPASEAP